MKTVNEIAERFWKKVDKSGSCWIWHGASTGRNEKDRYGQFWHDGKIERVHRYSYRTIVGEIPKGYEIDHICNKTLCVNPDHLRLLTNKENILRGNGAGARNRRKTHCPQGHQLGGDNLFPRQEGDRSCRKCHNAQHMRRYYAKKLSA